MLQTTISATTKNGNESVLLLDIENISGRRISDYRVELYSQDRSLHESDSVLHYPRWSESPMVLVARSLQILAPATDNPALAFTKDMGIAQLRIVLKLNSGQRNYQRELESIEFHADNANIGMLKHHSELNLLKSIPFNATDDDSDICHLAIRAICAAIFGTSNLPPYPEVFNPIVYAGAGFNYVRLNEIPDSIRTEFSKRLNGCTVPMVPGEHRDNVAFSWDWDSFANN